MDIKRDDEISKSKDREKGEEHTFFLGFGERCWEEDRVLNVEVSLLRRKIGQRHALSGNQVHKASLGHLVPLQHNLMAVEVLHHLFKPQQGLLQRQLLLDVEVVSLSGENRVGLEAKGDNKIARGQVGGLVSLPLKGQLLSVGHAPFNTHSELVASALDLLSSAHRALDLDDLALSSTGAASGKEEESDE